MLDDGIIVELQKNGNAFIYTFQAAAGSGHKLYKGNKGTSDTFLYAIAYEPTTPTAVQNVSAEITATASAIAKKIADGKLIIEANGKQFNAAGAQVK
jgi:hypothetical protein